MDFFLLDKVWIFPAIMAASFLIILFFGKRFSERVTSGVGIAAISICFLLSLVVAGQWVSRVNNPPEGAAQAAAVQACGLGGSEGPAEAPTEAPTEGVTGATGAGGTTGEAEAEHVVVPVCASATWFTIGDRHFEAGTILDGLSALMLFTVTLISMLVHIYSTEYLHDDRRFTHYYAFLSLFTAAMLSYVLASNTLQMLVGWELVGLCSFVLIGHWWEEKANSDAALKAFITNRVGDVGLIIGVVVTFFAAGASSFNVLHINEYALGPAADHTLLLIGALCLFGGVTSKSGQFPLHTWLPDAMAGPTPVSALIHAATMVVAGVYLIARVYGVFWTGLTIGDNFWNYAAVIGGVTTLIGACLAFVQTDIKKVLAYSTISQLGYMVLGLGVGAWTGAIFHLFTHAMFKACLFLGAGSVSHACHHTFDMRKMGGLKKYMPKTRWTFLVATAALAGLPLFSGFWSKDEILAGAYNGQHQAYTIVFVLGIITAGLTAAYMTRAYWMTFEGEYRGHGEPHESPRAITTPLIVLAFMSVILVFANIPKKIAEPLGLTGFATRFEHFVEPTFAFPNAVTQGFIHPEFTWLVAGLSLAGAALGSWLAWSYYNADKGPHGLTQRVGAARAGYQFLVNKYYLDYLYTDVIVAAVKGPIARAMYWVNMKVIDQIVNVAGSAARLLGGLVYRYIDQGIVDTIVNGSGHASEGSGQYLRRFQTGKVQQYASVLFGASVAFVIILIVAIQLSSNV